MREHFRFLTIKEAWDFFTKAARLHFAKLIRKVAIQKPELRKNIRTLKYYDYCARLMYILNMWAIEGKRNTEFGLEWAMLLAKPLSADQARRSVNDLIRIGLMGKNYEQRRNNTTTTQDNQSDISRPSDKKDERNRRNKNRDERGGDIGPNTRFNFDE